MTREETIKWLTNRLCNECLEATTLIESQAQTISKLQNLCVNVHNLAGAYRTHEPSKTICQMFEQPEEAKALAEMNPKIQGTIGEMCG